MIIASLIIVYILGVIVLFKYLFVPGDYTKVELIATLTIIILWPLFLVVGIVVLIFIFLLEIVDRE